MNQPNDIMMNAALLRQAQLAQQQQQLNSGMALQRSRLPVGMGLGAPAPAPSPRHHQMQASPRVEKTGLTVQELKAMTAMRMGSSTDSLMNAAFVRQPGGAQQPLSGPGVGQPSSASYIQQQQRARQAPSVMTQPVMQTVIHNQPSISPRVAAQNHPEKAPVHSLTVQELKELTRMRLAREAMATLSTVNTGGNASTSAGVTKPTPTSLGYPSQPQPSLDPLFDAELSAFRNGSNKAPMRCHSANSLLTATTRESIELSELDRLSNPPYSRSSTNSPDTVYGEDELGGHSQNGRNAQLQAAQRLAQAQAQMLTLTRSASVGANPSVSGQQSFSHQNLLLTATNSMGSSLSTSSGSGPGSDHGDPSSSANASLNMGLLEAQRRDLRASLRGEQSELLDLTGLDISLADRAEREALLRSPSLMSQQQQMMTSQSSLSLQPQQLQQSASLGNASSAASQDSVISAMNRLRMEQRAILQAKQQAEAQAPAPAQGMSQNLSKQQLQQLLLDEQRRELLLQQRMQSVPGLTPSLSMSDLSRDPRLLGGGNSSLRSPPSMFSRAMSAEASNNFGSLSLSDLSSLAPSAMIPDARAASPFLSSQQESAYLLQQRMQAQAQAQGMGLGHSSHGHGPGSIQHMSSFERAHANANIDLDRDLELRLGMSVGGGMGMRGPQFGSNDLSAFSGHGLGGLDGASAGMPALNTAASLMASGGVDNACPPPPMMPVSAPLPPASMQVGVDGSGMPLMPGMPGAFRKERAGSEANDSLAFEMAESVLDMLGTPSSMPSTPKTSHRTLAPGIMNMDAGASAGVTANGSSSGGLTQDLIAQALKRSGSLEPGDASDANAAAAASGAGFGDMTNTTSSDLVGAS